MTETGPAEPTSEPAPSEPAPSEGGGTPRGRAPMIAWGVGLAAHLVIGIWYAASGLVSPPWGVGVLLAIWFALLVVGLRLRTRRPWWMLAVPVLDVVIWVAVVTAGETFFGWTA